MTSPPPHPASLPEETLLRDCDLQHSRASGPGGQHRNKVQTAVHFLHRPTGLRAGGAERRSQAANRRVAIQRLRVALAIQIRCERSPGDPPSELWRSRCRDGRIAVNVDHDDFPTLLAEALDTLAARRYDFPAAADNLGVTPTQLLKLLRKEPAALERVNQSRAAIGLPKLR